MSKDAVKFGRMSKKQKAKVASELKAKNSENAAEYACIIQLQDLLPLLELKYGHLNTKPTEADILRCDGCGSWMIGECKTCQPTITNVEDAD